MNILLVCPRQPGPTRVSRYQRLAAELVRQGERVHLVMGAARRRDVDRRGVLVHELPGLRLPNRFSARIPALDAPLTWSQAVYECLQEIEQTVLLDIVDVALDDGCGFVTLARHSGPVVVRVREAALSSANGSAEQRLWRTSLGRAAGVLADSGRALDLARSLLGKEPLVPARVIASSAEPEQGAAEAMAWYREVVERWQARPRPRAERVVQLMDALDYGDAVGSIALRNASVLTGIGGDSPIFARYWHERVAHQCRPFDDKAISRSDGLLFHYWGFTEFEKFLRSFEGPKAVDFHNLTPTRYFSPGTRDHEMTSRGAEQLRRIAPWFDLILGDSEYDLDEYARWLPRARPTLCLYPTIDADALRSRPVDDALLSFLRREHRTTFLFVGRIARNKRQDRVMDLFDHYWRRIDRRSRLYLVGNGEHSPDYLQEVESRRAELASGGDIVLTGKVSDEQVQAYYRAADVFVSASEHEGFGMPLVEAMAHGVPVVALARAAVAETMGQAGIRVQDWDTPRLGELIRLLVRDDDFRRHLLEGQAQNLTRFTAAVARRTLTATVDFLREGRLGPEVVWRGPGAAERR